MSVEPAVRMRTPEGTELVATVYRPEGPGPFPALLTRTPYGRANAGAPAVMDLLDAAQRGFLVVVQDVRGRGESGGGAFEPGTHEAQDGAAAVEWVASLPGCSGEVGMWGRSYFAETQLRAASRHPEALRAMATVIPAGLTAEDGALYRGGALEIGSRLGWAQYSITAGSPDPAWARLDRRVAAGDWPRVTPLGAAENDLVPEALRLLQEGVEQGPGGTVAQEWDAAVPGPVDADVLVVGGWFDIFLLGALDLWQGQAGSGHRRRLVIGPWAHTNFTGIFPDISFPQGSAASVAGQGTLHQLQMQWFRQTLGAGAPGEAEEEAEAEGKEAPEAEPPVAFYVMGTNRWVRAEELPQVPLDRRAWPRPDGSLELGGPGRGEAGAEALESGAPEPGAPNFGTPETTAELVSDPLHPVTTHGGATMMPAPYPAGPRDQRRTEEREDVLVFTSAPVREETTLFGRFSAHVELVMGAVDADVVVRLCAVDAEGTSRDITDGIARVSHRDRLDEEGRYRHREAPLRLAEAGQRVGVDVMLWPTAWTLRPGERLRLQITGSCWPRWDVNPQNRQRQYLGQDAPVRAVHRIVLGGENPTRVRFGVLDLEAGLPGGRGL